MWDARKNKRNSGPSKEYLTEKAKKKGYFDTGVGGIQFQGPLYIQPIDCWTEHEEVLNEEEAGMITQVLEGDEGPDKGN